MERKEGREEGWKEGRKKETLTVFRQNNTIIRFILKSRLLAA